MGRAASKGVPAVAGERGSSALAAAAQTRHRAQALIGDALTIVMGKGGSVKLAKAFDNEPKAWVAWALKELGEAPPPGSGGIALNFNGLFAGAAAAAAARPGYGARLVEATALPEPGVLPGYSTAQVIDNADEIDWGLTRY